MFKWIKSLFVSETVLEENNALQAKDIVSTTPLTAEKQVQEALSPYPEFEAMTKLDIDIWARTNINLNIDRRRTKQKMIEEINNHLNKEN